MMHGQANIIFIVILIDFERNKI